MINFRQATSADSPLLESIYKKQVEDHTERARRFADELVFRYKTILAIKDDDVCGTVTWEPKGGLDDGVVEMIALGVNEGFRRQGIATRLVDTMIKESSQFYTDAGYTLRVVLLFMEKQNEIARKFYTKNKFKEVAVIPSLYPHNDASIWTRQI